ncbi:MAG: hypothetical protein OXC05_10635 [Halieaceae bacterium]|nr:hypothetical protein [Halieaceae bacterium]
MTVTNDDMPHPVPPSAYLRYKENWFFLIFDRDNGIFGAIHIVSEPIFERITFACHFSVQGQSIKYGSQIDFPENFAFSPELGDDHFTIRFVKAHEQIDLSLHNDDLDLDVSFTNRGPLFNFDDFDSANPDKVPLKEVMGIATNQQHVHQQQGMLVRGNMSLKTDGTTQHFSIDTLGYRDHSRSIRSDNLVLEHIWTGLHFPNHIFGVMTVTSSLRPHQPTHCGYVYDEEHGLRALGDIEFEGKGEGPDDQPADLTLHVTDINGRCFTLIADLSKRFASVPLQSEKPGPTPFVYDIVENFAPLKMYETDEAGIGLVEIGKRVRK